MSVHVTPKIASFELICISLWVEWVGQLSQKRWAAQIQTDGEEEESNSDSFFLREKAGRGLSKEEAAEL